MLSLFIIINIVLIECILSVDNAAALATLVKHLPKDQRKKALRYGMIGAYMFRGTALFCASWLIRFSFLKLFGGLYLLYITYRFFFGKGEDNEKENIPLSFINTVILVEIMDIAFSIDNILAVIAITNSFIAIIIGVFIGIFSIRFASVIFSDLLEKYPVMEKYAFVIIGILGMKLCLTFIFPGSFFDSGMMSGMTSAFTIGLFAYPILFSKPNPPCSES